MRIAWLSHAPWEPTGYGQQTAQVTKRLVADGHEVAVLGKYDETTLRHAEAHSGFDVL